MTDNKGANVVIDFVGQSHFNKNIDSMAVDGRMTILSLLSGMFAAWVLTLANSCFRQYRGLREPWTYSLQTSSHWRLHPSFSVPWISSRPDWEVHAGTSHNQFHSLPCLARFKSDVFSKITGEGGKGPIWTYIHKASNIGSDLIYPLLLTPIFFLRCTLGRRYNLRIEKWPRTKTGKWYMSQRGFVIDIDYGIHNSGKIIIEVICDM